MPTASSSDVLVIGGGVVGLSVAYQLACDGAKVTLLERGTPGHEASWAGAGILPPASWYEDHPALDALAIAAAEDHKTWSQRLHEDSGIDDEYTACGATYLQTQDNAEYLAAVFARWRQLGIRVESTDEDPHSWFVEAEAQVRNPRRLKALVTACRHRGVQIVTDTAVERFETTLDERLDHVVTPAGRFSAAAYCFAAGAWTPGLATAAGGNAPGRPIRGQMLLLRPRKNQLRQIVHRFPYYAVPRRDGRVLVGATVEDAGFDKQTTDEARRALLAAAEAIEPTLADAEVERHWSGLRPASGDGLPQIGPMPGVTNAWLATGHHRCGLQLAPPTARLVSAMLRNESCDLPSEPFDPRRFVTAAASAP